MSHHFNSQPKYWEKKFEFILRVGNFNVVFIGKVKEQNVLSYFEGKFVVEILTCKPKKKIKRFEHLL